MRKLIRFLFSCIVIAFISLAGIFALEYVKNPTKQWDSTPAVELTDVGSPCKFYYSKLSNIEQHAYNAVLSEIFTMPKSIKIPNLDGYELKNVFSAILNDNPEIFFLARTCTLEEFTFRYDYFIPAYILTPQEYQIKRTELEEKAQELCSELGEIDAWQKERAIHDYIVNNCDYEYNGDDTGSDLVSSAYGAIIEGRASCEGYSKAAKYLMDKAGVTNAVVSGNATNSTGESTKHMWNAVMINGKWYYLDCTWDDPISQEQGQTPTYTYFNITSELISASHSDFSFDFPCDSLDANYHVMTGTYFTEYDRSMEDMLASIIADRADDGHDRVELRFETPELYRAVRADLFRGKSRRIDSIFIRAAQEAKTRFPDYFSYIEDEEQCVLTLIINID